MGSLWAELLTRWPSVGPRCRDGGSAMNFSGAQVRQLRRDNAKWPVALKEIPREHWPPERVAGARRLRVMRSRSFLVQIFREHDHLRLTVNRTDWDETKKRWREDISWDDLQRLKAEAGYDDMWAVEIFPPEAEIINVANMRHIWVLPEAPLFAWRKDSSSRNVVPPLSSEQQFSTPKTIAGER